MTDPQSLAPIPLELETEAVELLERLAAQSSQSENEADLRRMADELSAELRRRELEVTLRDEPDDRGVALPVVEATSLTAHPPLAAPLLLIGHFDTVLAASRPHRVENRLWATGAIDMKGGIVAFLKALDLIALRGGSLPALRLVLVPDEEVGGAISQRAVHSRGAEARALWVLEPGEGRGDAETLVTGRRGMFPWRLEVRGRAAHSGLAYWNGRSAVVAAATWVARAESLSRPGSGPTVNVARLLGGEASQVEALCAFDPQAGSPPLRQRIFGSSHQLNIVPDRAIAEGEVRFLRGEDEGGLRKALASLADEVARNLEVEIEFDAGKSISPVDPGALRSRLPERAARFAREAGWQLEIESDRGGISFPNFLPDPGRIPVLDGLGPVGSGMHTRDEQIEIRSLGRRIRLLADLLQEEATLERDRPVSE